MALQRMCKTLLWSRVNTHTHTHDHLYSRPARIYIAGGASKKGAHPHIYIIVVEYVDCCLSSSVPVIDQAACTLSCVDTADFGTGSEENGANLTTEFAGVCCGLTKSTSKEDETRAIHVCEPLEYVNSIYESSLMIPWLSLLVCNIHVCTHDL